MDLSIPPIEGTKDRDPPCGGYADTGKVETNRDYVGDQFPSTDLQLCREKCRDRSRENVEKTMVFIDSIARFRSG